MRSTLLRAVIFASFANIAGAQPIPLTIPAAEAEGAAFARADPAASAQSFFAGVSFGGSSDRRCVGAVRDDSPRDGSLRSGDFIARMGYSIGFGFQATKEHKVLWIPLHGSALLGTPLVVRAVRVGHPADSIRFRFPGLTRGAQVSGPTYGYPSTVRFTKAGQWLVIATARDDWGCFVVDVADPIDDHRP